ncbi:MAG: lactate utilization protein [Elusimicrobiota bacterium]|jgi:L-lactate utilization protein LutB|nr:lactate utilization protein [Elusimicrobiota bacterium]
MANFNEVFSVRSERLSVSLIAALESRHFEAYYCPTKTDALNKALSLIAPKTSVCWGGSETIGEIGLIDELRKRDQNVLLDVDKPNSKEEREQVKRNGFFADNFLMSSNAITEDGQLVNVDGFGNRVASLIFGPKSVIVVAGMNKVCADLESAISRARHYAAPLNSTRLEIQGTPCMATGKCCDCKSPNCICAQIVITRFCKGDRRIKVILVGQSLGY